MASKTPTVSEAHTEAWRRDMDPGGVGKRHRAEFVLGAERAIQGGSLSGLPDESEWFAAGFSWVHREKGTAPTA